jgi:hypothetical protein
MTGTYDIKKADQGFMVYKDDKIFAFTGLDDVMEYVWKELRDEINGLIVPSMESVKVMISADRRIKDKESKICKSTLPH